MFCPDCGSILRPTEKNKKKILFCSCGYKKEKDGESASITEKVDSGKKIEVIEKLNANPRVKTKCEKCGHGVATYWTQQTRASDEPETRFFKCEKCANTWREY
jgi:DNA-directed RNA polymerase subunit M